MNGAENGSGAPMAPLCPGPGGERWWVWLVTSCVIYICGLSLSTLAYVIYYIVKRSKEKEKNEMAEKNETAGKSGSTTTGAAQHKRRSFLSPRRWREIVRQLVSGDTIPSKIFITFILLCNATYIILAIVRTYSPIEMCFVLSESPALIVELTVVIFLLLFTFVRFCAADTPIHYWLNLHTIVDVFTLPHIFVSIALGQDWLGLRTLRFIWLTQLVQFTRFIPYIPQDAIDLFSVLFNFLILWLTGAGIIHLLEVQGDPWGNNAVTGLSFLDFCYYVMITLSTVGYGDISPSTDWGRAYITFFIIGGLAFFAAILPALAEVTTTVYRKLQYAKFDTTRVPRHVIVCGHINATSASEFLNDFLHPDRGDKYTHVLFLHPERPDQDLKTVLRSFYTRVQFIVGSVLNGKDLLRAKINKSSACFIIANKHCENPIEEDNANLLRLVSIKNTTTEVPVILQLLDSSSKQQVYNIEGWTHGRDIAITLNELKLGLLGQSCVSPGFSTLIANLFYTSDFPVLKHFDLDNWQTPYIKGASNEIYSTTFSYTFNGELYHDAARICYTNLGLILLAVEDSDKLYINPSPNSHQNLVIRSGKDGMYGYFIGQDQKHVELVSTYCEECHGNDPVGDVEKLTKRLRGRKCSCAKGKYHVNDTELATLELSNGNLDSSSASVNAERQSPKQEKKLLEPKRSVYMCQAQSIDDSIINPESNVTEHASHSKLDVKDHVVLCVFANENSAPLGLHNFLRPLRSNVIPLASVKPVVIVSNKTFLEKEWPQICMFPDIHLVIGSPLHLSNLEEANVGDCNMCVIITALSSTVGHELAINDKEAVLCSLSIQKRYNKHVQILTDLNYEANVQFLDFGDEDQPDERIYKAQPFACGEAFSVSMFDSVTSSAFHSPGTVYIIEKMINTSGPSSSSAGSCQVIALPLKDTEHATKTFGELYDAQLDKRSICLAIYRQLPHDSSKHYVITAPDSHMSLKAMDIAFVMVGQQNDLAYL